MLPKLHLIAAVVAVASAQGFFDTCHSIQIRGGRYLYGRCPTGQRTETIWSWLSSDEHFYTTIDLGHCYGVSGEGELKAQKEFARPRISPGSYAVSANIVGSSGKFWDVRSLWLRFSAPPV